MWINNKEISNLSLLLTKPNLSLLPILGWSYMINGGNQQS
jgi:hypothetical protein